MTELCMVTGGCGFIGRELVSRLVKKGRRVRVLDAASPYSRVDGAEYIIGDLLDPRDTDSACDGVDTLFHLAAVGPEADADEIRDVNIDGTANLLESACLTGVKTLVFASSTDVYGSPPAETPCHEGSPLISTGPFSLSKIAGEEICMTMRERAGMRVSAIRPPVVMGPGFSDALTLEWIVDRAINHQPVFLPAGGGTVRHYIDVGDCAEGFIAAAEAEAADGHCFNLGYDKPHSDEDFAKAVIRAARSFSVIVPVPKLITDAGLRVARATGNDPVPVEFRDGVLHDAWFATDKARALLGWKPEKRLPVTLHEFMRWYKRKLIRQGAV